MNMPADRGITAELYGGNSDTRLLQEIVLGIGGWRLLGRLGIRPEVCHLNEGHAAFAVVERAAEFMKEAQTNFDVALAVTRGGNVFTTHTPVAAGFDRFDPGLVAHYLGRYADRIGIGPRGLLALGRLQPEDATEPLNMAYLAIRGSGAINGVSRLHGAVSREISSPLFPRIPVSEVPVSHVTNGVHPVSWVSSKALELWRSACGEEWMDQSIGRLPRASGQCRRRGTLGPAHREQTRARTLCAGAPCAGAAPRGGNRTTSSQPQPTPLTPMC